MQKDNKALLIAGGTLLFYMAIIPIADGISTYIQNRLGIANMKLNKKAQELQAEIESSVEEEPVRAVGFHVGPDEEEWVEDG